MNRLNLNLIQKNIIFKTLLILFAIIMFLPFASATCINPSAYGTSAACSAYGCSWSSSCGCPSGYVLCNGVCKSDVNNCGGCGATCFIADITVCGGSGSSTVYSAPAYGGSIWTRHYTATACNAGTCEYSVSYIPVDDGCNQNCASYCTDSSSGASCQAVSSGSTISGCSGTTTTYTCSGQTIQSNSYSHYCSGGSCQSPVTTTNILTCNGTCGSYCKSGYGVCQNAPVGTAASGCDSYKCGTGYNSAQNMYEQRCDGAGNCNSNYFAIPVNGCLGTCGSYCKDGYNSCQYAPANTKVSSCSGVPSCNTADGDVYVSGCNGAGTCIALQTKYRDCGATCSNYSCTAASGSTGACTVAPSGTQVVSCRGYSCSGFTTMKNNYCDGSGSCASPTVRTCSGTFLNYCDSGTVNTEQVCQSTCNNGEVDGISGSVETCDNTVISCSVTKSNGLAYAGTQSCNSNCNGWNTCTSTTSCGDNSKTDAETCDNGASSATKTASCNYVDPNSGLTYTGTGVKNCNSNCNGYDSCVKGTAWCGDGTVNYGEKCDAGSNNGVNTCTLTPSGSTCTYCTTACTIVTVTPVCGDGVINVGEECDEGTNNGWELNKMCSPQCAIKYNLTLAFNATNSQELDAKCYNNNGVYVCSPYDVISLRYIIAPYPDDHSLSQLDYNIYSNLRPISGQPGYYNASATIPDTPCNNTGGSSDSIYDCIVKYCIKTNFNGLGASNCINIYGVGFTTLFLSNDDNSCTILISRVDEQYNSAMPSNARFRFTSGRDVGSLYGAGATYLSCSETTDPANKYKCFYSNKYISEIKELKFRFSNENNINTGIPASCIGKTLTKYTVLLQDGFFTKLRGNYSGTMNIPIKIAQCNPLDYVPYSNITGFSESPSMLVQNVLYTPYLPDSDAPEQGKEVYNISKGANAICSDGYKKDMAVSVNFTGTVTFNKPIVFARIADGVYENMNISTDQASINRYCLERGFDDGAKISGATYIINAAAKFEYGPISVWSNGGWYGSRWGYVASSEIGPITCTKYYRPYNFNGAIFDGITSTGYPVCDVSQYITKYCENKGYDTGVRASTSSGSSCSSWTGSSWIVTSGSPVSVNCSYAGIGSTYKIAFTDSNGRIYKYGCNDSSVGSTQTKGADGVCVDTFYSSGIPLCGIGVDGLHVDPDCGIHTNMKCGLTKVWNATKQANDFINSCSVPASVPHRECLGSNGCVYDSSASCVDIGANITMNTGNYGNQILTCSANNTWCPQYFEYVNGSCKAAFNNPCDVDACPESLNFTIYPTGIACRGYLQYNDKVYCTANDCPTITDCASYREKFFKNPGCTVKTSGKISGVCSVITSYPYPISAKQNVKTK